MKSLWAALAFFILAIVVTIGIAVYVSVNADETPDPVRDPQPIEQAE